MAFGTHQLSDFELTFCVLRGIIQIQWMSPPPPLPLLLCLIRPLAELFTQIPPNPPLPPSHSYKFIHSLCSPPPLPEMTPHSHTPNYANLACPKFLEVAGGRWDGQTHQSHFCESDRRCEGSFHPAGVTLITPTTDQLVPAPPILQ